MVSAFIRFILFFFGLSFLLGTFISPGPVLLTILVIVLFVVSLFLTVITEGQR